MKEQFKIRTDLALEAREEIKASDTQLEGIIVRERTLKDTDINITRLDIINKKGEKLIGKPVGTYITLEAPLMAVCDKDYHREISKVLAEYIDELIKPYVKNGRINILVAGLGNREVTPDALGPNVVDNLAINNENNKKGGVRISGISPGVMAQTGMETAVIIKGIVSETKPDAVIVIDALAARNTKRLNSTIQLTDTGIHPGSGVGNHRSAITKETIGTNVVAIGVPTVIDTPTIVYDTLDNLLNALSVSKHFAAAGKCFFNLTREEKYRLIKEISTPEMAEMFVTPKDADETIKRIGFTISEAINILT